MKGSQNQGAVDLDSVTFLYQAAHQCLTLSPSNLSLCRFYIYNLKQVVEKNVRRLHHDVKRRLCRRCYVLLYPGITASIRIKRKPEKHTVVKCLDCGTVKRFLHRKGHQLWTTKPEALTDEGAPTLEHKTETLIGEGAPTTEHKTETLIG